MSLALNKLLKIENSNKHNGQLLKLMAVDRNKRVIILV